MMKAFVLIFLCLVFVSHIAGESVGSIATINTFDGKHFGPYIVKDFHSHAEPVAAALVDEEGSGEELPYLDTDTESGDDDPSGNLPTNMDDIVDSISLHAGPALLMEDDENGASQIVTTRLPTTTTTPSTTTSTTTTKRATTIKETTLKQTTTTTAAPTPAKSTSKAPPVPTPTQSAVTAENSSCHSNCQQLLYRTSLTVKPNSDLIQEAETMGFTCEVNIGAENIAFTQELSLHWVFEGGNPPQSECALAEEKYLAQCESFSTRELKEGNATFQRSHLVVSDLATHNSGYYKCQVRVNCCSNTLQHELSRPLTVWTADYTADIAILSGITAAMLLILVAGLVVRRRNETKRSNLYKQVPNNSTKAEGKKTESHLPFVVYMEDDDCDSFSSVEDY